MKGILFPARRGPQGGFEGGWGGVYIFMVFYIKYGEKAKIDTNTTRYLVTARIYSTTCKPTGQITQGEG